MHGQRSYSSNNSKKRRIYGRIWCWILLLRCCFLIRRRKSLSSGFRFIVQQPWFTCSGNNGMLRDYVCSRTGSKCWRMQNRTAPTYRRCTPTFRRFCKIIRFPWTNPHRQPRCSTNWRIPYKKERWSLFSPICFRTDIRKNSFQLSNTSAIINTRWSSFTSKTNGCKKHSNFRTAPISLSIWKAAGKSNFLQMKSGRLISRKWPNFTRN